MKLSSPRRARSGFTIIEVMIVVAIIGILAIIAIPSFMDARIRSQDTSFVNSLRLQAQNLELYSMGSGRGNYPPDSPVATTPDGLGDLALRRFAWDEQTPIGGSWDWYRAPSRNEKELGYYAGIGIVNPARTSAQMADIDARVDDGNLDTGLFRRNATGYIHIIEQ